MRDRADGGAAAGAGGGMKKRTRMDALGCGQLIGKVGFFCDADDIIDCRFCAVSDFFV